MNLMQKFGKAFVASMLCFTSVFSFQVVDTYAQTSTNLALNKPVVASKQYSTMPASHLTDADEDSRWSTEAGPVQWAYIDLGQEYEMNKFQMIWESKDCHAEDYNIYVSNNVNDWSTPVVSKQGNDSATSEELLAQPVKGRYVKLEVTKHKGYQSVSCRDFKVLNTNEKYQDPTQNVALNKTATASSIEAESVKAANAFDGNTSDRASRWGSDIGNGPDWIYVDLGEVLNVNVVKVFWENRKATNYKIQVAETLSETMSDSDWTTVKEFNDRPATIDEKIVLDKVYKARYVRLYIDSHTSEDPDGGTEWNTVSIYEMEVYGGNPDIKPTIGDVLKSITVDTPAKGDKKLTVNLPDVEGYKVEYNGTDFEQVIDEKLNIYQPVVDKEVSVSFKVTDLETKDYKFKEVKITVPGKHAVENGDNEAPNILPELAEWKGNKGSFEVKKSSKIVIASADLQKTADALAADYEDMTGNELTVVTGTKADVQTGDFYFALTTDASKGLQKEGYLMNVADSVSVEAETTTGAYWATRTILQSIKQTQNIPCGVARDYPLYAVRGFILDVGRKTFTLDYLKQVVKQMSWYKMNDFQVHLNDNLIGLENLADPMTAYSAFRLESDVKKGGNNGLNQQDLTSTDMFYTKDEFRDFIKESRSYGVDIVPEIDTPAHSLALTKVRPDLRHGTNGRENDHLALRDKYDECVEFVKGIFDEYMKTENPVFDGQTTVHVGADEYNADKEAYRKFSDDMLGYVQETGRTARIWGSLSQCRGTTPVRSEGVQMNLWNFGYANMDEMYEQGFDLINCNDGNYYIVPNAGYYYDYLYDQTLYNLDINTIGGVTIPAGDKQMVGGAFAVWNDMTDYLENGVSEYDVYDRIENAIPLFGAKLWGKGTKSLDEANVSRATLGDAPRTNFAYDVASKDGIIANYPMDDLTDTSANNRNLTAGANAAIAAVDGRNALKLNGNESYVNSPLTTVGLGNDLRVKVKRTSASNDEQVLFESEYGSIKAVQKGTGKVGFTRENHDYSFDYELPLNEWVELEIKNIQNVTKLYVNGQLVDVLGDGEKVGSRPLLATTMFPVARIGSKTNAFVGYVDDVRLGTDAEFNSTMELDYAVLTANVLLQKNTRNLTELADLVAQANEIFKLYAPEKVAIDNLTTEINTIIKATDYAKADYSKVNKYLALVLDDLSAFTDASVKHLQFVIDSIRYDLPAEMQNIVDAYAQQLENALAGLELKQQLNVNYVDNSKLKATASSYQKDGSSPDKVLDNDPGTMWHTDWSVTTLPHWIAFEAKEAMTINGLTYVPRQTGSNGNVTEYRIEVSDNGNDWREIKTGKLSSDSSTKVIEFDEVTTKFIRLVYVKAINNNGSAAEIKLHNANVPADVDGLNALITKAEGISNIGYTQESWQALQDQIKAAKELATSQAPDANDVEIAKRNLIDKMVKLVLSEDVVEADKEFLATTIAYAKAVTQEHLDKLVPAVVKEFKAALLNAETVRNNASATQDDVNAATMRLIEVIRMLEFIKGDVAGLQSLVDEYGKLEANNYTADSFAKLQSAIDSAITVLSAGENALEVDVNKAKDALKTAYEGLVAAVKVDKSKLQAFYDKVKDTDLNKYLESSRGQFTTALTNASNVLKDQNATQKAVDEAYSALVKAFLDLRLIPNKEALEELINKAESLNDPKLAKAIAQAKAVVADKNATEAQVKGAYATLEAAIKGLDAGDKVVANGDKAVATGDNNAMASMMALAGLSLAGLYLSKKRRSK